MKYRESKEHSRIIISVIISSVLAWGLYAWQNISIDGFSSFAKALIDRKDYWLPLGSYKNTWRIIITHYHRFYSSILLLLFFVMLMAARGRFIRFFLGFSRGEKLLIYLSLFPIITHPLVYVSWNAIHEFSVIQFSVPVSFLLAFSYSKLEEYTVRSRRRLLKGIVVVSIAVFLLRSVQAYCIYYTNNASLTVFLDIGKYIAAQVSPEEVVFAVSKNRVVPQIIYYAGRNIQRVQSVREAEIWLKGHKRSRGIVFYIDEQYRISSFERVSV
jgi:hypothetical protein